MRWADVARWLGRLLSKGRRTNDTPGLVRGAPRSHKLTREDVLQMIEENGGPKGLDLSGQDLSWLDLGREVISHEAENVKRERGRPPIWQNERNGGVNLNGVNLANADLFGANLAYADLKDAILDNAMLKASCLARTWLGGASLRNSDLSRADLSGARAMYVDLQDADLGSADLTGTDFDEAKLQGASVYKAILSGTRLSRRVFGDAVLQEDLSDLSAFLLRHNPHYTAEVVETVLQRRQFEEARQVYASLKANFLEIGNFEDASWAHIKERRMGRKTHSPMWARDYYGDEFPNGRAWLSRGWWKFYLKHTAKWLLDWAAELSCGYGERPLRTVGWAGVILLIFPFLYALSGDIVSTTGPLSWLEYFNYSLGAFTTIGFGQFEATTPLAQTLTSLQALLGISILALLMFALGNRISRS